MLEGLSQDSPRLAPDLLLHPLAQDLVPSAQGCPRSDAPRVRQAGVQVLIRDHAVVEAQLQSGEDRGVGSVRVGVARQCREIGCTARRSPGGLVRVTARWLWLLYGSVAVGLGL